MMFWNSRAWKRAACSWTTRNSAFAECVRSAVKIVQPEATAKGLAVRHKIDPQIPAVICGDATRLRHVVFNLLDNAVKFTTTGSVMLSAVLESKSTDAVLVRVSVADTGIGIPPNKQRVPFRTVPAGGWITGHNIRRNGPGTRDFPQTGGPDGRNDGVPKPARRGEHIPVHCLVPEDAKVGGKREVRSEAPHAAGKASCPSWWRRTMR